MFHGNRKIGPEDGMMLEDGQIARCIFRGRGLGRMERTTYRV